MLKRCLRSAPSPQNSAAKAVFSEGRCICSRLYSHSVFKKGKSKFLAIVSEKEVRMGAVYPKFCIYYIATIFLLNKLFSILEL